jgi:hypothetical protein
VHLLGSSSQFIFVEQPTEPVSSLDFDTVRDASACRLRAIKRIRNTKSQASVGALAVVVVDVGLQHSLKVTPRRDEEPVQALGPNRSHPPLGERVCPRRSDRSPDHCDPLASEDPVEDGGKLSIAIVEEQSYRRRFVVQGEDEVARLLGNPGTMRCCRAVGQALVCSIAR